MWNKPYPKWSLPPQKVSFIFLLFLLTGIYHSFQHHNTCLSHTFHCNHMQNKGYLSFPLYLRLVLYEALNVLIICFIPLYFNTNHPFLNKGKGKWSHSVMPQLFAITYENCFLDYFHFHFPSFYFLPPHLLPETPII